MSLQPERYKRYRATVNWHKPPAPPDGTPCPAQGQEAVVRASWLMSEDDPFPGEIAFLIEQPAGFNNWLPQRDLILHEEVKQVPAHV